jgi:hypothetical protein
MVYMKTKTARVPAKIVVIDPERSMFDKLSHSERFLFRVKPAARDCQRDAFLILPATALRKQAELLRRCGRELSRLRLVFVLMDTDFDAFFDKLAELKIGSLLARILRVGEPAQVDRVLHAWCDGLQKQRFADARLEGSRLVAKACDLSRYEIDLAGLRIFAHLDLSRLPKPSIDSAGVKLIWASEQTKLDFDTVRYQADPKYRIEKDLATLEYYPNFGAAVRKLREEMKLTQEAVSGRTGFSTRHLSRIENSEQTPTAKMLEKLSGAHGLTYHEYIERLLCLCSDLGKSVASRS